MKNKPRKTRSKERLINLAALSAQLEAPHTARWLKASRSKKMPSFIDREPAA